MCGAHILCTCGAYFTFFLSEKPPISRVWDIFATFLWLKGVCCAFLAHITPSPVPSRQHADANEVPVCKFLFDCKLLAIPGHAEKCVPVPPRSSHLRGRTGEVQPGKGSVISFPLFFLQPSRPPPLDTPPPPGAQPTLVFQPTPFSCQSGRLIEEYPSSRQNCLVNTVGGQPGQFLKFSIDRIKPPLHFLPHPHCLPKQYCWYYCAALGISQAFKLVLFLLYAFILVVREYSTSEKTQKERGTGQSKETMGSLSAAKKMHKFF